MQAFFGLSSEYRKNLFDVIDDVVIATEGAYSFDFLYNAPIWLRRFIVEKIRARNKEKEEAMNKIKPGTKPKIHRPDVDPTYTTKVPKK